MKIIGIDLGTTNSVVSVMEGSKPKILINSTGNRSTPSVVAFTKTDRLVGASAKRQQITNFKNTIFSVKRFMGRKWDEVSSKDREVGYTLVKDNCSNIKIKIMDKEYSAQEISAIILQDLKNVAEDYLGEKVEKAVITVPAYFNDSQRQATKDAGKIAGLEVERIINEPTAAALAYGFETKKDEKIAVFDFGGGTFDISILDIGDNVFEVLSTNGNTNLGGDNIDDILMDYIVSEFKKENGIDLKNDKMAYQRIKESAEKTKIELSQQFQSSINLPFITANESGPIHLQMTITRSKFEYLIEDVINKLKEPCLIAIKDAKISVNDISEVLLVGGSTRIPAVCEIVKNIFNKEPNHSINPDEVVSMGAALQGAILSGDSVTKDILLLDVTPLSLGLETLGGICTKLIEKNTTIPTSKKETFSTASDMQLAVDINVLQGERDFAKDNRTLGKFQLVDIPPSPRGVPKIEVTFDIDANGILNVSAKDIGTGKEQSIEIKSNSGLSEEDIENMTNDATAHEKEDAKKKDLILTKNQADNLIYSSEKTLKEHEEKISKDMKENTESSIKDLKEHLVEDNVENIKKSIENLNNNLQEIGKILYEEASTDIAGDMPDFMKDIFNGKEQ